MSFQIPPPYQAWCHLCNKGFMSMDELLKHNADNVNHHIKENDKQRRILK
jgi:hypothetical protein